MALAFSSLGEHLPRHLLLQNFWEQDHLAVCQSWLRSAVGTSRQHGGKWFVSLEHWATRKTRKGSKPNPTFMIFFLLLLMVFKPIAWQWEGGRRGTSSPYFLACGVDSTCRVTRLVNVGDREGRSISSPSDVAGTPVKNSYSYTSASSPWYQKGRTEGEMTENRGEWSRATEERETRRGSKSRCPDEKCLLLSCRCTVTPVPWVYRQNDAARPFTQLPLECFNMYSRVCISFIMLKWGLFNQLIRLKIYIYICMYKNRTVTFFALFTGRTYTKWPLIYFLSILHQADSSVVKADCAGGQLRRVVTHLQCCKLTVQDLKSANSKLFSSKMKFFYLLSPLSVYKLPRRSG